MSAIAAFVAGTLLFGVGGDPLAQASARVGALSSAGKGPSVAQAFPRTGLGGYTWLGQVRSIAAQWQVPTVEASSPVGLAATWIGAQDANGLSPFIQIGTTESALGGGVSSYGVFWSDYAVGDQPQYIGYVRGGDVLAMSMRRTASGWQLVAKDQTSHKTLAATVAYEPEATFDQGEWLQEDPPAGTGTGFIASRDASYPRTTTVRFEEVKVNGAVPDLVLADGQTLSATGDVFLVPTQFRGDSFQLLPAKGFARRYLLDAAPFDSANDVYQVERLTWASDDLETRVADLQHMISACQVFDRAVERVAWPAATRPPIMRLAQAVAAYAAALERWARVGAPLNGPAFEAVQGTDLAKAARAVDATLGLPPP